MEQPPAAATGAGHRSSVRGGPRRCRILFRAALGATAGLLLVAGSALAGPPEVIWSQANPGGLAASVGAVAWAPDGSLAATGLSDRWVRIRNAEKGQQVSTILQPIRSRGVVRLQFSGDSQFLAVANSAGASQYRIYQVSTGTFLGLLQASVDSKSIVHFTADAQLAAAPGGAGQLAKWKLSDLPVFVSSGSGYDVVVTRFQLSQDGTRETAIAKGTVTVRQVPDGLVLRTFTGKSVAFSPNSATLAVWTSSPNQTQLYRTSDLEFIRAIPAANGADSIQLGWTPAGNLVGSGYLPFVKSDGTWDQKGIIRFWSGSTGVVLTSYDQELSIGVTSGVAFDGTGSRLAVGLYDGTTIAAANSN
jgi:WD40 repeat protein